MLEVSPREIDRLIEQTVSPVDLLEHRLKQLLLGYKLQAREELDTFDSLSPSERSNYLPTFEIITLKRNTELAKDSIERIAALNSERCPVEAINSILIDITISYLTNRDFEQLLLLIESELFSSNLLSDPKLTAAVSIICQDELSNGGQSAAAKILKVVNPAVLNSDQFREALSIGFQTLLYEGKGDALLKLAKECPSGPSILKNLLTDSEAQKFIAHNLNLFSDDFRLNQIIARMFSTGKFQELLLRKLSDDIVKKNLEEFIDYCSLVKISSSSIGCLRSDVTSRVADLIPQVRYLKEELGPGYIRYLLLKDTIVRASIVFSLPREILIDLGEYNSLEQSGQLPKAA